MIIGKQKPRSLSNKTLELTETSSNICTQIHVIHTVSAPFINHIICYFLLLLCSLLLFMLIFWVHHHSHAVLFFGIYVWYKCNLDVSILFSIYAKYATIFFSRETLFNRSKLMFILCVFAPFPFLLMAILIAMFELHIYNSVFIYSHKCKLYF